MKYGNSFKTPIEKLFMCLSLESNISEALKKQNSNVISLQFSEGIEC